MAIASQQLYNMTVVSSDNAGTNQGLLMPKLAYRFRVTFSNFGADPDNGLQLTKQIIDCARPQVTFEEITLNVYNSRMYLAGRHAWQTLAITIRDDASGLVTKAVGQQVQRQLDFVEQASAASGQDYKFQTNIQILDGGNGTIEPVVLEDWQLLGCFIQNVNYNQLAYATNDAVNITMTLRYDNAIQTKDGNAGPGVGEFLNSDRNPTGESTGAGSAPA